MPPVLSPELAERVYSLVARAARQPDVQAAVEANHDDNRWWPLSVTDWPLADDITSRVSYLRPLAEFVGEAETAGTDLTGLQPEELRCRKSCHLCDLGIFADQAAEPVPSQRSHRRTTR
jgi:hypothetical protein